MRQGCVFSQLFNLYATLVFTGGEELRISQLGREDNNTLYECDTALVANSDGKQQKSETK